MNSKIIIAIIVLLLIGFAIFRIKRSSNITNTTTGTVSTSATVQPSESKPSDTSTNKTIAAKDIPGAHSDFKFLATVPAAWSAEAVRAIDSINFYDPAAPGASNLEKSQIFIRKFTANDFLTLSTVTIHSRTTIKVNNRPAVRYDIEKKSGIANFANQPAWRSARHIVTDVRVSDANPSVFYVIAKRPDLDQAIYDRFLNSLHIEAK